MGKNELVVTDFGSFATLLVERLKLDTWFSTYRVFAMIITSLIMTLK